MRHALTVLIGLALALTAAPARADKCDAMCSPAMAARCKKGCEKKSDPADKKSCTDNCEMNAASCKDRCHALQRNKGNPEQGKRDSQAIARKQYEAMRAKKKAAAAHEQEQDEKPDHEEPSGGE